MLTSRTCRAARGLLAIGLGRGDRFGVWSTNWPQWVLLQFATARIGVILVTVNPAFQSSELQYTLAQSEVRGLALIERHRDEFDAHIENAEQRRAWLEKKVANAAAKPRTNPRSIL